MKLLKFGGTSIETPERIETVIRIITESANQTGRLAVVFSAFGGVTDTLIQLSRTVADGDDTYKAALKQLENRHLAVVKDIIEIKRQSKVLANVKLMINELEDVLHGVFLIKELTPKTLDFIQSFGERLSAYIINECLATRGMTTEFLDARKLIVTDKTFGAAKVDYASTNINIRSYFDTHPAIQIITGFIGATKNNETTTLGRGGSDYSATIIGAALDASEIEIWTDVDGLMTADPQKVHKAFPIESMTYEEAMEMAHFGARVIHPPAMQPASEKNIPIRIKNTFNPEFKGTFISNEAFSPFMVKGISSIDEIALLRVQGSGMIGVAGISNRLFGALAKKYINVILISQASSEHTICFAVEPEKAESARETINDEFSLEILAKQMDEVVIEKELSIIAVVGERMRQTPGIAGKLYQALGRSNVNVRAIAQGSSELNISTVISKKDATKALNAIYETFFLADTKPANLFVVGTGLIGGTLLNQIQKQNKILLAELGLDINVIALGNIDFMLFDENSIDLKTRARQLEKAAEAMNLTAFVNRMIAMELPNSIFVDCTASDELPNVYEKILCSGISIVTPNKKANSGSFELYRRLKRGAARNGVKFLYETNVGAGLPVIHTLQDLIYSGDRILKIEAVLSGTLNYIFTALSAAVPFSQAVRQAREKGFSEPDPRDDLNGLDFARKMLILARESGLSMELEDIFIEALLPESCLKTESVELFIEQLTTVDAEFEQRRQRAEKQGNVLRFAASLEREAIRLSMQEVDRRHPFYTLAGSDNMIVFTTERYRTNPLVIKGPGAGAEVTAGGVFADITRIFNH
ncbi:bifunctional aspartate kinase/homoserine dehydrogenase I [candidate division KSB1 bacterium]|nr:bifunctional aspartate kinase/homoserine dehydrogenase I [candidate division KSB1 bacterium]